MILIANSDLLGKNIRFLRRINRVSRRYLCHRCGGTVRNLRRLEWGKTRDIDAAFLIYISFFFQQEMMDLLMKDFTAK